MKRKRASKWMECRAIFKTPRALMTKVKFCIISRRKTKVIFTQGVILTKNSKEEVTLKKLFENLGNNGQTPVTYEKLNLDNSIIKSKKHALENYKYYNYDKGDWRNIA